MYSEDWWDNERAAKRTAMPQPVSPERKLSLWSIIKQAVSKDLRHVALPIEFHLPQSDIQTLSETCAYTELLNQACTACLQH